MFVIPRPNVIQSDEGFSVEVLGLTGLLYSERSRSLRVDSEVLGGKSGLMIYKDSIKSWNPPHDADAIDETQRNAIVEHICSAFRFRGFEVVVVGD